MKKRNYIAFIQLLTIFSSKVSNLHFTKKRTRSAIDS